MSERNKEKVRKNSEIVRVLKQLSYNRLAMAGAVIFLLEILAVTLAPILSQYDYNALNVLSMGQKPSLQHWFGTDELGRDIFTRILYGGRYSISMGVLSMIVSLIGGMVIGAVAGYFGGWVDNLMMRFLDIIQSLPGMLLIIVLSAVLGAGYFNTILALGINGMPGTARLLRGQMLKLRGSEYIEASQSINCSKGRIIVRHLIPNSLSPLIVDTSMGVANSITMASALSFIGLGVQPPAPEWGAMLSMSRQYIRNYPHMVIFPGLAIAITVLALNLLGDGLRDALDPKMKR